MTKRATEVREWAGSWPYYQLADRVVYVTRGLAAERREEGIELDEWRAVIAAEDVLSLEETYEITNPHTELVETWREPGRARCLASDGSPVFFGYMPRHVTAITDKKLPSIRLSSRLDKIKEELGAHPPLEAWRGYVEESRYLDPAEVWEEDGKTRRRPGRAVTKAKSGGLLIYRPSAVWAYYGPSPYEAQKPDKNVLAVARRVAGALGARVVKGRAL